MDLYKLLECFKQKTTFEMNRFMYFYRDSCMSSILVSTNLHAWHCTDNPLILLESCLFSCRNIKRVYILRKNNVAKEKKRERKQLFWGHKNINKQRIINFWKPLTDRMYFDSQPQFDGTYKDALTIHFSSFSYTSEKNKKMQCCICFGLKVELFSWWMSLIIQSKIILIIFCGRLDFFYFILISLFI